MANDLLRFVLLVGLSSHVFELTTSGALFPFLCTIVFIFALLNEDQIERDDPYQHLGKNDVTTRWLLYI